MNEQLAQQLEKGADNMPLEIRFKRLSENAMLPTKAHASDSGWDLYASEDVIIAPGETVVVLTDLVIMLPEGYEAQLRPRSGITSKTKLRVQLGTIDESYRGNVGIIVDNISPYITAKEYVRGTVAHVAKPNHSDNICYSIKRGDKIAQLVIQKLPQTVAIEITDYSEDTERGTSGFGSSGV